MKFFQKKKAPEISNVPSLESVPGLYYCKDRQGVYVSANTAFTDLIGDMVLQKNDHTLWPLDAKSIEKHDKQVLKDGKIITVTESFTLPNKQTREFIVVKSPWKDKKGNIIGLHAHLTDITGLETKPVIPASSQAEVRKSIAANIEDIVICAPGSIYWKDLNGVYLGCNDYMVREAGLSSRASIVGKTDNDLWPEQAEKIRKNDLIVIQSGKPVSMEEFVEGRVFYSVKMPLRNDRDQIIGIICNSHDITYLKEIEGKLKEAKEQSEAANRAKSEFLATVSHELRSPLTSILGMIHFLSSPKQISELQRNQYLKNISISAKHLLSLVNDFLDFAKLEAGKFDLISNPMDLKSLILETITILMPQANAKKLEIIVDYDSHIPRYVLGDSRAIRQIIINLAGNAIKFTNEGTITISVKQLEKNRNIAKLLFSITDTGIGIPTEKLGLIFEYFQQADYSYRRRYGGTGLGLSITKKLVEAMDGSISVHSQENVGSTFECIITFPLQDTFVIENPWVLHQEIPILIVADSLRGEVLRKQIESPNSQTASSNEAFNLFIVSKECEIPYEIVVIDDDIQSKDPYELATQIMDSAGPKKPMLLLLASTPSLKAKRSAEDYGFFETIVKPVQPVEFQTILTASWEKWVEKRSQMKLVTPDIEEPNLFNETSYLEQEPHSLKSHQKRVLLVDDEPMVQLIHKNFLIELDCSVDTASSGEQALKILEKSPPYELMFADMGMPGMSGIDLVKYYREQESSTKRRLPIIALTSYSSQKDKQNFMDAGVDDVLVKPVTPEQLNAILKRYLS